MRIYLAIIIICFGTLSLSARTIIDMTGRNVEVPDKINRVFPYDPKISILLFSIAYEKMPAISMLPGKKNYQYLSEKYSSYPEVDVKNIEEVLTVSPDIIIAAVYNKNDNTQPVMKLGSRLKIPVVLVDLSLDKLDKSYSFLGKLLNIEDKTDEHVSYLSTLYKKIKSYKSSYNKPEEDIYYTLGSDGMLTDPAGSKHTEVFDLLNIPNAAKIGIPSGGHAQVNMEQILMWNPDYIFTSIFRGADNAYETITTDSKWRSISAVKNNHVYRVPSQPFGWFDHPPSINRIPGIIWMCQFFYGQPEEETKKMIHEFYKLFYKYELSDADYAALFK